MNNVTKDILKEVYPVRPPEVKKYDYGLMVVIGGSEFYSGSPALIGFAGFKAGVDMVRIIAPKRAADIIASFSPIMASYPLEDTHVLPHHLATLLSLTESAKEVANGKAAVALGGGIGRSQETLDAILAFLKETTLPVVIDGDALYAVFKEPEVVFGRNFILTPNTHEFTMITGQEVRNLSPEDRIPVVKEAAAKLNTTILLKAKTDIISDGQEVWLNDFGSPYLSIGGAGDTLTGITCALFARGISSIKAACAGAYINGRAGEAAAKEKKESLVATDIIDAISGVIN